MVGGRARLLGPSHLCDCGNLTRRSLRVSWPSYRDIRTDNEKNAHSPPLFLGSWRMYLTALALVVLSYLESSLGQSSATQQDPTCALIARSISSSSAVFYPTDPSGQLSASYVQGISHWAVTSTQQPKCVVEPGTAADVSKIVSHFVHLNFLCSSEIGC